MATNYSNSNMIGNANIYETVQGLTPYSTPHNLSYQTTGTGDMGLLYPHFYMTCLPGDKVSLNAEMVVRLQPHLAPLMHEIHAKVTYFFVPHRLMWKGDKWYNKWETWITGAVEGTELTKWNEENPDERIEYPNIDEIKWNPYERYDREGKMTKGSEAIGADIGTIWESIGMPYKAQIKAEPETTNQPIDLVKRAYNKVWNDWYRDQNLQKPVHAQNDELLRINWARDRFTAAGYEQQKGVAPALGQVSQINIVPKVAGAEIPITMRGSTTEGYIWANGKVDPDGIPSGMADITARTDTPGKSPDGRQYFNASSSDVANAIQAQSASSGAFNVSDLRLLIALQKAMEIDMRTGSRYFEYIKTNFNTTPRNDALQRAEYIGQIMTQINMAEVLQTSATETNSALGEMAGHGIGTHQGGQDKTYFCQEHGILIGLLTVVPRPQYQQGVPADLMINSKYEVYRPQFAYLSEEPIRNGELYYTGETKDEEIWGYNGRWDHLRIRHHKVTGLMRTDVNQNLSFWNLARNFENRPNLNSEFLECIPRKDWLVVPSQPALLYTIGWKCWTERKIPATSEPGLLDHVYGEGNGGNTVPRTGNSLR